MKKKTFLGLNKRDWNRLAQYCYDAKWQARHENSGFIFDSMVLAEGVVNMGLLDQAMTAALSEAERLFSGLKYTKHPDRKKNICECCGRWEWED